MTARQQIDTNKSYKGLGILINPGLGRTLLVWMALLALLPLAVVSLVSLENARLTLREEAFQKTQMETRFLGESIEHYFQRMILELRQEAEQLQHRAFLQELTASLTASGQSAKDFVKSDEWAELVEKYGGELKSLQQAYGYYDVFLISASGDVLFSVARENDLGSNLFSDQYTDIGFSTAVKRSLLSGETTFSDAEYYQPSNNLPASFLIAPLAEEGGNIPGVLAYQVSAQQIESIISSSRESLPNADIYLLGPDLKLRSSMPGKENSGILASSINTRKARTWHQFHVVEGGRDESNHNTAMIYTGPSGDEMLGAHYTISILGVPWAVIAEVDAAIAFSHIRQLEIMILVLLVGMAVVVAISALLLAHRIARPFHSLYHTIRLVAAGESDVEIQIDNHQALGELTDSFNTLLRNLHDAETLRRENEWAQKVITGLYECMRGNQSVDELGNNVLASLARNLSADIGAIYVRSDENKLQRIACYAFDKDAAFGASIDMGEGLVGQAAYEGKMRIIDQIPKGYLAVSSGLGKTQPTHIIVLPFAFNKRICGVLELGKLGALNDSQLALLRQIAELLGVAVTAAQGREQTQQLLLQSQTQADELQCQAEEMQQQEEELRALNEELEEQNRTLQQEKINLGVAQQELLKKAKQLSQASKYKSEFLANMSHELRTPLNSVLLLSKGLTNNRDGNLNDSQIESAEVIYQSGKDLLELINDILDLSKIEAGRVELDMNEVEIRDLVASAEAAFSHQARHKGIQFEVRSTPNVPEIIHSDYKRIEQIIRNLLSNALKFTQSGGVILTFGGLEDPVDETDYALSISVRDTGIGIPEDKHQVIFEAFQQADGSTSRNFGGTGLGLSISRKLATLLGGELRLQSEPGEGSTFTLYLPRKAPATPDSFNNEAPKESRLSPFSEGEVNIDALIADDRDNLLESDHLVLIIEDDTVFAKELVDHCHHRGFKCLSAGNGQAGVFLAKHYQPMGIILDLTLPDINGWQVLEKLKSDQQTRLIPVHIASAQDATPQARQHGAIGFMSKPVESKKIDQMLAELEGIAQQSVRKVLLVEDDQINRNTVSALLTHETIEVVEASCAAEAREALQKDRFDCMVLDLGLPDIKGNALLRSLRNQSDLDIPPVIIYTGHELSREEELELREYSDSIVIKNECSDKRLLDEVSLFLHKMLTDTPDRQQQNTATLVQDEELLQGKKVLIIDDDLRTLFALSKVLYGEGMVPLKAAGGKKGLELLNENPDVDLVLTDIMMPEMDGYQTITHIRELDQFKHLPIIALTAKAMRGDRARCIEAGASDYLAKPIDPDRLFSLLRVWLSR